MNLLLNTYSGQELTGWYMSEKLDGWRARWDGARLLTRSGSVIEAPDWFLDAMPHGEVLDGELWAGRGNRSRVQAACQRRCPVDDEWRGIYFMAFDAPRHDGPFSERAEYLLRFNPTIALRVVNQILIGSQGDAAFYYQSVVTNGGEGLVFRSPRGLYVNGRDPLSLKCKPGEGAEALV